ncbi:MAG: hypothetical protein BJ554DRAFT_4477 [Olpidium bornovanus]|uniref:Uncharacterized protein n=1 Tax=Olpidium bornovanus TaxID=278681 RepID=A0A8H8DF71_9FUNG|nr:MAG: hypothetical protein BJ554DRAFT_4477 [Olpidium bornovanus]
MDSSRRGYVAVINCHFRSTGLATRPFRSLCSPRFDATLAAVSRAELTELVPGILNQLGPDSLASLRKIAETYQQASQVAGVRRVGGAAVDDDDEEVPELVDQNL